MWVYLEFFCISKCGRILFMIFVLHIFRRIPDTGLGERHRSDVQLPEGMAPLAHFFPPLRFRNHVPTFAVRETASLGIMGAPRVPP